MGALAVVLALLTTLVLVCPASADQSSNVENRYNVVIVLDASKSMDDTDPEGLRYEAINQFISLLADQGNYLGGVVFAGQVEASQDLAALSGMDGKQAVIDFFEGTGTYAFTNIGQALSTATDMIAANGDPNLPSVIVFLSDGNTEVATNDALTESLDAKAAAIQAARDNSIPIYSVCLNADNSADITEMQQISTATGGIFSEIQSASDLPDIFNSFYALIYGTSTIPIPPTPVPLPDSGTLETPFEVPGLGVEEVNIIISGGASAISLITPNGSNCTNQQMTTFTSDTFTLVKITDTIPGEWTLITQGTPGDMISINLVFNTDLGVVAQHQPQGDIFRTNTDLTVTAQLQSGGQSATTDQQCTGFSATLEILDTTGAVVDSVPMTLSNGTYTASYNFGSGTYSYQVTAEGYYLTKTSPVVGPLNFDDSLAPNSPPVPVEDRVSKTVYIIPFQDASVSVDLSTLATDPDGDAITYEIVSSSFLENTDYTVDGNTLTQTGFSLSRGSYTVRATDARGLSCDIEVEIITHNVGIMALIGIGIAALVTLIVLGILLWIALTKRFSGTITVWARNNGQTTQRVSKTPRRGRCKLSLFQLPPMVGLDFGKCYFQASGKEYVELVTNKPVYHSGQKVTKVRVDSNVDVTISLDERGASQILMRFESKRKSRIGGRGKTPSGPRPNHIGGRPGSGGPGRPGFGTPGRPGASQPTAPWSGAPTAPTSGPRPGAPTGPRPGTPSGPRPGAPTGPRPGAPTGPRPGGPYRP